MKYLKVFTDFALSLTALNDAECGRLFKAMLEYAATSQEPDLRGNERFVWPSAKASIDRDTETYRRKAETAQGNAKKRSRTISCNIDSKSTALYDSVQDKDKDKDVVVPPTPYRGFGDDDDLLENAEALNDVFDAAAGIGLTGAKTLDTANRLVADYSSEWVLEAISRASNAPKDAWCWRYIEGILRSWKTSGGIDNGKPQKQAPSGLNPWLDGSETG